MKPNPSYEGVMKDPLAKLRQKAAAYLRKQNPQDILVIVSDIHDHIAATAPLELPRFVNEWKKAQLAISTRHHGFHRDDLGGGTADDGPDLSTPELQLLWGVALASVARDWNKEHEERPLEEIPMWQSVAATDLLEQERRIAAHTISAVPGLRERAGSLKVEWSTPRNGYPDTGFYCDTLTSTVHLDLIWTLIAGVEPARSLMLRETAHGIGTLFFTPAMHRIRDQMAEIKDKDLRSVDEHKEMLRLAAQWLARFDVTCGAEDNYAQRFAADRTKVSAQDFSTSLHFAEAATGGIPEAIKNLPTVGKSAGAQLENIKRALHYAYFGATEFFDKTTEAGWRSVGVEPGFIVTSDGAKRGMAALGELCEMAAVMERLQPQTRDAGAGDGYIAKMMDGFSRERCDQADRIFDRFASHLIPELEKEAEANPDKVRERMKQLTGGDKKDDPSDMDDGDFDEDGEPGDGEGGEPGEDEADVEGEGRIKDVRLPPKDPKEGKGFGEDGEPMPGEGEPGEGEPGEGEGEPGEGEGEPGEGEGEPGDGEGEDGEGEGEYGDAEEKDNLQERDDPSEGEGGKNHGDSFTDEERELEEDGKYNEYLRIIEPHADAIRKSAALLKKMKEKLSFDVEDPIVRHSLVPEDGDVGRFESERLKDRLIRQMSGQSLDESDFENFRMDGPMKKISPQTEIHICIDGSGSMSGAPINMAIQAGCVLYEAAREAGLDVYITMLGSPHPLPIAKPGMSDREIGKNIDEVSRGLGGDEDYLAPTMAMILRNTLQQKKDLGKLVGNTHMFVITDAMFTDQTMALDHVKQTAQKCPHLTLDLLLINGRRGQGVVSLADEMNRKAARNPIGYKDVMNPGQIHDVMLEMLNDRLRALRPGDAIQLKQKQREFKTVKLKNDYGRGRF